MASAVLLLLQLLLLTSLVSASHHWGGTTSFTYKGRNPDGSVKMSLRTRDTYDACYYNHYWYCYSSNCGHANTQVRTQIDTSTNTPSYKSQWCESETVETWTIPSDKPFNLRAASCCWISTRNSVINWNLDSQVDFGTRSDTRKPNKLPDIAIVPFLRVPENCPRTYRLAAFDPDGDRVRCRYGNNQGYECDNCQLPSGFQLDQDSCTLHYQYTNSDYRTFGFEMVVEDYARGTIDLFYSDGSSVRKYPLPSRTKRQAYTTTPPTTTNNPWSGWQTTTTTEPTTTTAAPTTTLWWWWQTTTTPTTTTPWWWRQTTTVPTTTTQSVSSTPLSKQPLQFSFLVDPPIPSCQEGLYLPKFESPTPSHGTRIKAEVNKEMEIRVKATAAYSSIQNIIFSGPTNVTKHRDTNNDFIIRWTPTEDDLGEQYPICFVVESVSWNSAYQSEMRCVLVEVQKHQIEATVTCTESAMKVEVDKASFFGLQENHLRLSDSSNTVCSLRRHSNHTHIVAIIPLNQCGTQIEEDDDYLIFKNEITTGSDDQNALITRKHLVEARFYCQYPKRGNVTLSFKVHRKTVTVWEKGFGTFTYQLEFYQDNQFGAMFSPNSYPLEYDVGDRIYMQLDASSSVNNTEMFVESCRAAPYDNPNYHPTYSIIENGCGVDPTVRTYTPSNDRQFQFSVEAFRFIGLHDQVYISCTVMMCEAGNPNTRCSLGCSNSTRSSSFSRRKREAVVQSGQHFVSQGPLRLKREADPRGASAVNLNLNLMFVAGCLLAAVGMVCGLIIYKTKTSRAKYQPLPAHEN
ncbi:CUB and zona pellucida-like domain-containing protein 1 isoform X3 [Xiphophorus hellerii]|uniref:CUB and zona pellucida-like domain-containing protein 1 isoform X3 n=1 Tax=Xiphophorus hellerii TaxID=8084 RepID=UPI0013B38E10|nr:CUB and zona pellucida-like domain-containing protein 1 isoform X3 [Xiphophorus hellerii]